MIWIFFLSLTIFIGLGSYISLLHSLKNKNLKELSAEDFDISEIKDKEY